MTHNQFWLPADDESRLFVNHWPCASTPRAVVIIAHGLAEHSGRYRRFAAALNTAGLDVYAHDQRGHGRTAEHGELGHFADSDGWQKVLRDLSTLNHRVRQQHPCIPIFLFAHSLGSFIAQAYLMQHSSSLQGAVLCGSNYQPALLYRTAALLARFERLRTGKRGRSALLQRASFGAYNKAFKPNRTAFDWLSRDAIEVDRYVADPLCGFACSNQTWLDIFNGLQKISSTRALAQIDGQLPLLLIAGTQDPLSQGRGVQALAKRLKAAGSRQTQLKMYPDARHELLNESNRDHVTRDIIDWLNQSLEASAAAPTPKEPE